MTDVQAMVVQFHQAFGLPNRLGQGKPDAMHERTELRKDLNGRPIYREDGKVLKGPHYSAPNIKEVLGLD